MTEIKYIDEKKQVSKRESGKWSKRLFYLALVVIIFAFLQWRYHLFFNSDKECAEMPGYKLMLASGNDIKMHIHPILSIKINGEKIEIPSGIGMTNSGMNAMHTHAPDGVLHVESPCVRDFTLEDFFAVWGKKFDKEHILDFSVNETAKLKVIVNGAENMEFENLILRDNYKIEIVYGTLENL